MKSIPSLEPLESRIAPAVIISAVPSNTPEGNDGSSEFTFEVKLSEASTELVSVQFGTEDWTAKANLDYLPQQGLLTFAPGETSKLITIPILGDSVQEPNELLRLHLFAASGGHVLPASDGFFDGVIINDDKPQAPRISVGYQNAVERDVTMSGGAPVPEISYLDLTFRLNEPQPHPVTVTVEIGGTATPGLDYQGPSGSFTVTFAPFETRRDFIFTILGDETHEEDETLLIHLSNPIGASLQTDQAAAVIQDNDPLPTFSVEDSVAMERNYGTDFHQVRIVRSGDIDIQATVHYETVPYTATPGTDFTPVRGDLVFAPGETEQWISIPILGDLASETDEQFFVVLTNPLTGQPSEDIARITIQNDDAAVLPEIRISNTTSIITWGGQRYLEFTVALSRASTEPVSFDYHTANGTATAGSDYEAGSGQITIPAGAATTTIRVPILDDEGFELDETVRLLLSSPTHATLQHAEAIGTIISDDTPGLSISSTVAMEGMPFSRFLVSMDHALPIDVIVEYATQDNGALAGFDYQATTGHVVIRAGSLSAEVNVPLLDDGDGETPESFLLHANIAGFSWSTATYNTSILDDDPATGPLRVTPAVSVEGEDLHFTVTLDRVRDIPIRVFFGTYGDSVVIPAGHTQVDVAIPTTDNSLPGDPQVLSYGFSAEIDGSRIHHDVTGIILDDDQGLPGDFKINPARTIATWTDGDGDRVTLRVNRHVLDVSRFHFITSLTGNLALHELDLTFLAGVPSKGYVVSLTAKPGPSGGNGTVDLGQFTTNVHLKSLTVDGALNSIDAASQISAVRVGTLGADGSSGHGPSSLTLSGSLRLLSVAGDWNQTHLRLYSGNLGAIKVGGDFIAQAPGEGTTPTLQVDGRISSITVGGSISADHGADQEISIRAESLGRLKVWGDVEHTTIYAPYLPSIAEIVVKGTWEASNLYAGRTRGPNGILGDVDDWLTPSRLGKFQAGAVEGTTQPLDQFHLYARQIGAAIIHGKKLPFSKAANDSWPVPGTSDVTIAEYL